MRADFFLILSLGNRKQYIYRDVDDNYVELLTVIKTEWFVERDQILEKPQEWGSENRTFLPRSLF